MVSNDDPTTRFVNILVDIEWEHAHNSTGAPLSLAVLRDDTRKTLYAQWPVHMDHCSEWTRLHVLPKMTSSAAAPDIVLKQMQEWIEEKNTCVWASESAVQKWLLQQNIPANLWDDYFMTEEAIIRKWWAKQNWMNKQPQYHALWDVRGMWYEMHVTMKP